MTTKKKVRSARQWKVVSGLHIDKLERELEKLSASKWLVVTILGDLGNLSIVATRLLTNDQS